MRVGCRAVALPASSPGSAALVTGASSGLGEAMAPELARREPGVVLVPRSEDRLRALAGELAPAHGVRAEAVACDVTDPAARDRLEAEVSRLGLRAGMLGHQARLGTHEPRVE